MKPGYFANYSQLRLFLLGIVGKQYDLIPEASALSAEIARRELGNAARSRGIAYAEPLDTSPEEWAKRRVQFRWVWMGLGAFMALGVILVNRCNGDKSVSVAIRASDSKALPRGF